MRLPDDFWPEPARPGWSSRWRAVFAAVVELAVFVLALVAIFGAVLLVAASQDLLPR